MKANTKWLTEFNTRNAKIANEMLKATKVIINKGITPVDGYDVCGAYKAKITGTIGNCYTRENDCKVLKV